MALENGQFISQLKKVLARRYPLPWPFGRNRRRAAGRDKGGKVKSPAGLLNPDAAKPADSLPGKAFPLAAGGIVTNGTVIAQAKAAEVEAPQDQKFDAEDPLDLGFL